MTRRASTAAEYWLLVAMTWFRAGAWLEIITGKALAWHGWARPWPIVAMMAVAAAETVLLLGVAWRARRPPPEWAVGADLILLCAITVGNGLYSANPVAHTWESWTFTYSFLTLLGVGLVIRRLSLVLLLLAVWFVTYDFVLLGLARLPFPAYDQVTWLVNGLGGWAIARGVRGWAAQVDQARARELASAQDAAQANQRLEFVRVLHDHPLQTMEVLANGTYLADSAMRERVAEDAVRLRAFVRDGRIGPVGDLRMMLTEVVAAAAREGLTITVDLDGMDLNGDAGPLPEPLVLAVTGAVREALRNVIKHAGTRSAVLHAEQHSGRLEVSVADQGRGFDPATTPLGIGLGESVTGRITALGGAVTLLSAPGDGTYVSLRIPSPEPGTDRAI